MWKLEEDIADLEGWKHKCTDLQLKVIHIENNVELECLELWPKREIVASKERLVQQ